MSSFLRGGGQACVPASCSEKARSSLGQPHGLRPENSRVSPRNTEVLVPGRGYICAQRRLKQGDIHPSQRLSTACPFHPLTLHPHHHRRSGLGPRLLRLDFIDLPPGSTAPQPNQPGPSRSPAPTSNEGSAQAPCSWPSPQGKKSLGRRCPCSDTRQLVGLPGQPRALGPARGSFGWGSPCSAAFTWHVLAAPRMPLLRRAYPLVLTRVYRSVGCITPPRMRNDCGGPPSGEKASPPNTLSRAS